MKIMAARWPCQFFLYIYREKKGGGECVKNSLADLKTILHEWFCNPPPKLFTKMVVRVICQELPLTIDQI